MGERGVSRGRREEGRGRIRSVDSALDLNQSADEWSC